MDLPKLKAFADEKLNVAGVMLFVWKRKENIVGKGENAGYRHFLLILRCFQKASPMGAVTSIFLLIPQCFQKASSMGAINSLGYL